MERLLGWVLAERVVVELEEHDEWQLAEGAGPQLVAHRCGHSEEGVQVWARNFSSPSDHGGCSGEGETGIMLNK